MRFLCCLILVLSGASTKNPRPKLGLDLPMPPVRLGVTGSVPWGIAPDDDDDDPRDTPPPVFYGEEIDTENDSLIYVLDISGSMNIGATPGRIEGTRLARARAETIRSIRGLSSNFSFNVLTYSTVVHTLFPSRRLATSPNKAIAEKWLMGFLPQGFTATGPAVSLALGDRANKTLVLLTDGAPNAGLSAPTRFIGTPAWPWEMVVEEHRQLIRRSNRQGAQINVFGVQTVGITRTFCQTVALESGGQFVDVP